MGYENPYRSMAAKTVRELRKDDQGGREKARNFLDLAKSSGLYEKGEASVAIGENGLAEAEQTPTALVETSESEEREKITREIMNLIENTDSVKFGVHLSGYLFEKERHGAGYRSLVWMPTGKNFAVITKENNINPTVQVPSDFDSQESVTRECDQIFVSIRPRNLRNGEKWVEYKFWINIPEPEEAQKYSFDSRWPKVFAAALYVRADKPLPETSPCLKRIFEWMKRDARQGGTDDEIEHDVLWAVLTSVARKVPLWFDLVKDSIKRGDEIPRKFHSE